MKGTRRILPLSRLLSPSWDLDLVLDALSRAPFKPLDMIDTKLLLFKTALLLALASAKRVSEIHALSVNPACMQFIPGDAWVLFKPNPTFMPNIINLIVSLELKAFCLFASSDQKKLNTLCPVCALQIYTNKSAGFELSELFVSWVKPYTGKPITNQLLSH